MKKIKIDFVDFWSDLDKEDNYFINRLRLYYDVEVSKDAPVIFCSCFGDRAYDMEDRVKICFTGENYVPDFNIYDYVMGFSHMSFADRYLRLPLYALYTERIKEALEKHTKDEAYYLSKKKFCNRVVSNPDSHPMRESLFEKLCEYKKVDSGGRYKNNIGGAVKDKMAFERDYRFTLAFENTSTPGYVTEKILEAFAGDTIPVYWGDPGIAEEFNPAAFINCMEYKDEAAVIARIKEVAENDDEYLRMMKAPMYKEDSAAAAILKEDYADAFLRNIFDCEPGEAFRCSRMYYGREYRKKMKNAIHMRRALDVVYKPVHQIKKWMKQGGV
ncbi:MAG: hypothetical protein K6B44_08230 [Lachnospiraceae bacterium]|nr:hypothetical protein [Lachnospiraceae bacterium]